MEGSGEGKFQNNTCIAGYVFPNRSFPRKAFQSCVREIKTCVISFLVGSSTDFSFQSRHYYLLSPTRSCFSFVISSCLFLSSSFICEQNKINITYYFRVVKKNNISRAGAPSELNIVFNTTK